VRNSYFLSSMLIFRPLIVWIPLWNETNRTPSPRVGPLPTCPPRPAAGHCAVVSQRRGERDPLVEAWRRAGQPPVLMKTNSEKKTPLRSTPSGLPPPPTRRLRSIRSWAASCGQIRATVENPRALRKKQSAGLSRRPAVRQDRDRQGLALRIHSGRRSRRPVRRPMVAHRPSEERRRAFPRQFESGSRPLEEVASIEGRSPLIDDFTPCSSAGKRRGRE